MANHASAKKRIRRNARRTVINGARMSRVRTFLKKVELAILGGNKEEASAAFKNVQPELHRSARTGILPRNRVDRKLSRLSARVKAMS